MRVQTINNVYSNDKNNYHKTNFTATFKMNNDIKTFISGSKYENMVRFKEILKRMKKVKDDYVYTLEKKTYENKKPAEFIFDEEETVIETGYELSRQKGNNPTTKEWIAGFEDDGYFRGKLGELNDKLEDLYPLRAGKKTKEKMATEILDIMA